jgi:hypothetical protein
MIAMKFLGPAALVISVLAACGGSHPDSPPAPVTPPPATTGGTGGTSDPGGSGGASGSGGATAVVDASAPPAAADASPPPGDGPAATPGEGRILFELPDPLPELVQSHPSGDAMWIDDPTEGRVVRFRAADAGDAKERAEIDMAKDILKNGDTVWVGWRAKLEIASPGAQWRNLFQEKSYGSYQENVPFCLRADSNTLRLLDPGAKSIWSHPMILGTWFSIVMKIVYGTGQMGTIELWIDGEQQKFTGGATVAHLGTWGGGTQNMHWGVYRKGTIGGTDIHYVSHLRVATTRELATPPASAK